MLSVHDEYETAAKAADGNSLARFGDGELNIAFFRRPAFENYDERLSARLREILHSEQQGLLIGIPDIFSPLAKSRLCKPGFWTNYETLLRKELDSSREYYSTFFSRPDNCCGTPGVRIEKAQAPARVDRTYWSLLKKIWERKTVTLINFNPCLCEHPLFHNAAKVQLVPCPRRNAWSEYDEILHHCLRKKTDLFLASCGPVGTVIASDLHRHGHWAIDYGQASRIWSIGQGHVTEAMY